MLATLATCALIAVLGSSAAGGASHAPRVDIPGADTTLAPADFPNDPGFAGCESRDPNDDCAGQDDWFLYGRLTGDTCRAPGSTVANQPHPDGGLPCWAINAKDPQHSAGINATGAWAQGNTGRDDILIAYIEGGVNYNADGVKDALSNVYINPGESPYPQDRAGNDRGKLDFDGNGRFDIRDYVEDPRVNPACPEGVEPYAKFEEGTTRGCVPGGQYEYRNAVSIGGTRTKYLSPEDLIIVFGHCKITAGKLAECPPGGKFDNDANGYPNDVSGWNTYSNTNDAQTEDPGYTHPSGGFRNTVSVANNNYGSVGNCRDCRIMPVRQGAECLGLSDNWAQAIMYATNAGAKVISSVVVSYQYSSYGRQAIEYANERGVLLALDSNDFDSTDHTDGMLYPHAIPGNSVVADIDESTDTKWFRARSNITSYGPHNVFSGEETTTSGATPFMAGLLGMVQAASENAVDAKKIPRAYTPNEVRQVLMNTASSVTPQVQAPDVPKQWPGNPASITDATHTNWSSQYGYGRIDLGAATALVNTGLVPPTTEFEAPDWYAYYDPTKTKSLPIKGYVNASAWKSQGVTWTLEWATGGDPADKDFHTISTGKGSKTGLLGTLKLSDIPKDYAAKAPSNTNTPNGPQNYAVTLRIRAVDGGLKGEDRRAITVRTDPQLVASPRNLGGEPAAGTSYVDLEGRHEQDLVVGTADGDVHALRPDGTSVKGWPVRTRTLAKVDPNNPENGGGAGYKAVAALRDARDPVSGTAVGDLDHDGTLEVVATTSSGTVYAWSSTGKLLKGFPVVTDKQYWTMPVPTPQTAVEGSRLPVRGNWSPPVLADLEGNGRLSIIESSYDGHLYAWRANGAVVPGWPVKIATPQASLDATGSKASKLIQDPKLVFSVGVGDVLGTGKPQVFVSGFDCADDTNNVFLYGVWPDGNNHAGGAYLPNWPVAMKSLASCYDESIDFVEEGSSPPVVMPVDGKMSVVSAPTGGSPAIYGADGKQVRSMSIACTGEACAGTEPYMPKDSLTVVITGQGGAGDLLGTGTPNFVQSVAGAPSTLNAVGGDAGQATLGQSYEKAWDVSTGQTLPGYPAKQEGFSFFTAPLIAGLQDGSSSRGAVEGNDSSWIHSYQPDGTESPGFPKYVGQWPAFSGVVSDPRFDGTMRMAYGTREGYLFQWDVEGSPDANDQWWHYRHDEHNTGQYGVDTRRPAIVEGIHVTRKGTKVTVRFRAPGNDGVTGRARLYDVRVSGKGIRAAKVKAPRPAEAGTSQKVTVAGRRTAKTFALTFRTIDPAGNVSAPRVVTVKAPTAKKARAKAKRRPAFAGSVRPAR